MTFRRDFFEDFNDNVDGIVCFVDRSSLQPLGMGIIKLKLPRLPDFLMHNVLYLLELQRSLMSFVHIRQQGHYVRMINGKVEIRKDYDNMLVMTKIEDGRLLKLNGTSSHTHNVAYLSHHDLGVDARRMSSNANINAVFYATSYHPIQAGSIDGTDITPHDNGVYRAVLCATTGLYDPSSDPKVIGDPYCTVFVGRLSHSTTEESLKEAMNKYGRVKDLCLVRHIVTGASQGYAFVEYETEREMRHAYEAAYHSIIDDSQVIVDYSRQQLMSGWIPRRLGGGLGGRKESGQLRFGGRDRPFRAPLRPIPKDELKKLGIPLPPEGRYMSRFQAPPVPRRRSPDVRHHRQSEYRSSGISRLYGDASETLPDLKLDQENLSKKSSSSRLVNDEQERGVSVAKEPIGSFGGGDKAGDREGSMHADTDEGDSKSRSHHHHRHKHRSHTDRHTPHRHEKKRKERSSERKRSMSPDKIDEEKRKRWRHDKYSDYK